MLFFFSISYLDSMFLKGVLIYKKGLIELPFISLVLFRDLFFVCFRDVM